MDPSEAQIRHLLVTFFVLLAGGRASPVQECRELCQQTCEQGASVVNVTLRVRNVLEVPSFELERTVSLVPGNLLQALELAAEADESFRFEVSYIPRLGYYVDVINDLAASTENETFWRLTSLSLGDFPSGVARYRPTGGEVILFNFTTYNRSSLVNL